MLEPGARYDIVIDFSKYKGHRILMKNVGPDEPFKDELDLAGFDRQAAYDEYSMADGWGGEDYRHMDRVMAFDVVKYFDKHVPDNFDPHKIAFPVDIPKPKKTRRLALFEGIDDIGRLQPLAGTVDPAVDAKGEPVLWPHKPAYVEAGLAGKQMEGTMAWHEPTTEIIRLGDTEIWEIWNLSAGKRESSSDSKVSLCGLPIMFLTCISLLQIPILFICILSFSKWLRDTKCSSIPKHQRMAYSKIVLVWISMVPHFAPSPSYNTMEQLDLDKALTLGIQPWDQSWKRPNGTSRTVPRIPSLLSQDKLPSLRQTLIKLAIVSLICVTAM